MINNMGEEALYTILRNLLERIDKLFLQALADAGNISCVLKRPDDKIEDFDKKEMLEKLDSIQNQRQLFRDWVNSANKCFHLLGLPQVELEWIVVLDETSGKNK